MNAPDYEHWLEVLVTAIVALGCWLWRIGRKYQHQEDRIKTLEDNVRREGDKRTDRDKEFYTRFEKIDREQVEQNSKLDNINNNVVEIKQDIRELIRRSQTSQTP